MDLRPVTTFLAMDALTVDAIVRNAARSTPSRDAATIGNARFSFAELDGRADQLAAVLHERGVGTGDRILWRGPTSMEVVVLFAAAARIGAVFAPANPGFTAAELDAIVTVAAPAALIDSTDVPAPGGPGPVWSLDELVADARRAPTAAAPGGARPADPHVIFFTSGSTGAPKGVVLSHRTNVLRAFPGVITDMTAGGTVCMFPLFHMAAWSIALGCWSDRRPVHLVETPTPDALLDAVARHRAQRLYAIPLVWHRLLDHGLAPRDVESLRFADTGTSATPPELVARIRAALPHTQTRIFYGSTEAGPSTLLADAELDAHPGSVGRAQPGVEVRCDESTDGEVWVRSPMLMDGYFRDPEATAAALTDGWYRSGDLGALDADGFLSITGRARDVIRSGGETVAPAAVEAVLATHPAVAEVAVVGVPDPEWGECVCACVVAVPGRPPTLEELRDHTRAALAPPSRPRRLVLLDELPRTAATRQVQRTLLVERIQAGG